MKEMLVASVIILAVGCLLLAVGLTAVALSPEGLRFFVTVERNQGWPYEYLQISGMVFAMIGFVFSLAGALNMVQRLLGQLLKKQIHRLKTS